MQQIATASHNNSRDHQNYVTAPNKKAQMTQGLRATAPSFQDGRQPPSWILWNRK